MNIYKNIYMNTAPFSAAQCPCAAAARGRQRRRVASLLKKNKTETQKGKCS